MRLGSGVQATQGGRKYRCPARRSTLRRPIRYLDCARLPGLVRKAGSSFRPACRRPLDCRVNLITPRYKSEADPDRRVITCPAAERERNEEATAWTRASPQVQLLLSRDLAAISGRTSSPRPDSIGAARCSPVKSAADIVRMVAIHSPDAGRACADAYLTASR